MTRFRYIGWLEYGRSVEKLAELVAAGGLKFDLVIGIARGGVPVAMVVSDRLGAKVDFINVKSYSGLGTRAKPKILSTITEQISTAGCPASTDVRAQTGRDPRSPRP